jgi:hypothetical protein
MCSVFYKQIIRFFSLVDMFVNSVISYLILRTISVSYEMFQLQNLMQSFENRDIYLLHIWSLSTVIFWRSMMYEKSEVWKWISRIFAWFVVCVTLLIFISLLVWSAEACLMPCRQPAVVFRSFLLAISFCSFMWYWLLFYFFMINFCL